MFKVLLASTALAASAFFTFPQAGTAKSLFDGHAKSLTDAPAMTVTYTVQRLPAAASEYTLHFSKDKLARIESPSAIFVSNGSSIWEYDKSDNTFVQSDFDATKLKTRVLDSDVFVWATFFAPDAFKEARNITLGAKRSIRGVATQEVTFSLPSEKTITLYIDTKTGIARGGLIKSQSGEVLIIANELEIANEQATSESFKFMPPTGATKLEKPKEKPVLWADVAPIFSARCTSCHGTSGGLTLTSREAALRSRSIIPGNPDRSLLIGSIKWTSGPRMPQNGSKLSQEQIDLIEKWIAQGAN
jgi:outer membrane lipoprotein-sorting protein